MTPLDLWLASVRTWQVQVQSATLTGLRLAGMAGAWAIPPYMRDRMIAESHAAYTAAGAKVARAWGSAGGDPKRA